MGKYKLKKYIFSRIYLVKHGPNDFVLKTNVIKCKKLSIKFAFRENHSFVSGELFEWGSLVTVEYDRRQECESRPRKAYEAIPVKRS